MTDSNPAAEAPAPAAQPSAAAAEIEVSFVMPCLNESETLEGCIRAAQRCIDENSLSAEIIIADNGSTDGSQDLARRCGARVVDVDEKGYGAALMGGFEAARGRYLIMGDSDLSYDFGEGMKFIEKLRSGDDLVMGSRFLGAIEPGAMPWKHKWIGNPVLSWIGRTLFHSRISDFHCGLRALTKTAYQEMALRTTGMEFASELVVKATVRGMQIGEVPITLHPDGRSRPPHLRSWRDGWRHLRFLLTLSPRWTLGIPGLILGLIGLAVMIVLGPGFVTLGSIGFGIHTLIAASLAVIVGYQAVTTAIVARIFAVEEEIGPPSARLDRAFEVFSLERGILVGVLLIVAGAAVIGRVALEWAGTDFGPLQPETTMHPMIVGVTLIALGTQTTFMSFVYSMLGIKRRH